MTLAKSPEAPDTVAAPNSEAQFPALTALWIRHRNFALYAIIGCSGVLLDIGLFFLLFGVIGLDHQVANAISTTVGITNNFAWNSLVNFQKKDRLLTRFWKFYLVGIFGLLFTMALLWLFSTVLDIDAGIVKAGSLPAVLLLQFWLNKRWSFG